MTHDVMSQAVVDAIHDGTAVYTARGEISQLLDAVGWPGCGGRLLDPGCGDGNMLVAALLALAPAPGDRATARRVHGIEFHAPSANGARDRLAGVLESLGWDVAEAEAEARGMVETRDYLLDGRMPGWDVVLANPPYWRRHNLPDGYRARFDEATDRASRGDLLHAYLDAMARDMAPGGTMALVTSDRWLVNSGAAALRARLGEALRVTHARRLDPRSAFHRPKERARGTPPRVHAVSLVLSSAPGRQLGAVPFLVEEPPKVDGVRLADLVEMRLAPWLGPDGIFTVDGDADLPADVLVPCVEPVDICPRTGEIGPTRRWAIVTGDGEPAPEVLAHLDANMHRMPPRGRRRVRWLPPERFDRHLPLEREAILVPRIATRLRSVTLPPGHLPTNHSLCCVASADLTAQDIRRMLDDPRVQAQADALALRIESGFRSYTATLLRGLVIPHDVLPGRRKEAA
jgi:SAM-dependent methyltransferase